MKFPPLIALLLFLSTRYASGAVFVPPAPAVVSDDAMLAAIAEVETGNNAAQRGHYGERTQLQILPATWREFSRLPHAASASHPRETKRVARAYLAVIRQRLRARGLPETPFFIAAGWNAGAGWRRLRPGTVSYAERVSNLVEAAQKETEAATAQLAAAPAEAAPAASVPAFGFSVAEALKETPRSSFLATGDTHGIPVIDIGATP